MSAGSNALSKGARLTRFSNHRHNVTLLTLLTRTYISLLSVSNLAVVLEKLLREELSDHLALQKETLEWLGDCAAGTDSAFSSSHSLSSPVLTWSDARVSSVFVRRVGSESNAIAASGAKKENYRVSADHVLQALEVRWELVITSGLWCCAHLGLL